MFCLLCLFVCAGVFNERALFVRHCVMQSVCVFFFGGGYMLCVCLFVCGLLYVFVCCPCDLLCDDDCVVFVLYVL